jgi:RNA polymerase sigma-70 factor (ECF subfamily)
MDEHKLISNILSGDKESFHILMEEYQRLVANIVFRMVLHQEEREDLCQEIFIKVYSNLSGFKFKSKLSTWIAKISYNTCINHLQKKKTSSYEDISNEGEFLLKSEEHKLPTDESIEKNEIAEILHREIEKMPLKYRTILTLYHIAALSYYEIGEMMKIPEGTVKSHLFRGRQFLKERLMSKFKKEDLWK